MEFDITRNILPFLHFQQRSEAPKKFMKLCRMVHTSELFPTTIRSTYNHFSSSKQKELTLTFFQNR